jgi:predicted nucleic acid-binding protein
MASKIFIDANVLLDLTLKREHFESAEKIIELMLKGEVSIFVTPTILHIVGYWLTKAYGSAMAKELLLTLLADINVIDIPHEIALAALHSKIDDIEDALQYYTAIHNKIDYFISRDKKLNKQSIPVLPVYSPQEFLKEFLANS